MIIDFGEPARPLGERRLRHLLLRDVADTIRFFHYAAHGAIFLNPAMRTQDTSMLQSWADLWYYYTSGIFLRDYLDTCLDAAFIPPEREQIENLLPIFLLDKAIYELGYGLNNRPDWVTIPIRGIQYILKNKG